jgi:hypothetical protein
MRNRLVFSRLPEGLHKKVAISRKLGSSKGVFRWFPGAKVDVQGKVGRSEHLLASVAVPVEHAVDILKGDLCRPDALEAGNEACVAYRGGRGRHL